MRKIKVVEGMDLIRQDIRDTFEQAYIGRVVNDYDSKMLLVTAVNGYLQGLRGTVLDSAYQNEAFIDLDMQRLFLQQMGINTDEMSEQEILSANTMSNVFLGARVRFVDAMEDMLLTISM